MENNCVSLKQYRMLTGKTISQELILSLHLNKLNKQQEFLTECIRDIEKSVKVHLKHATNKEIAKSL